MAAVLRCFDEPTPALELMDEPKEMFVMTKRSWSLYLPLILVLLAGAVPAAHAQTPATKTADATVVTSSFATSSFGPLYEAVGAIIQRSTGCSASLDCPDGTEISCTGQQSCLVGSNYVECDGDRSACPGTCGAGPTCLKDFQCYDYCGSTFARCGGWGCCIC